MNVHGYIFSLDHASFRTMPEILNASTDIHARRISFASFSGIDEEALADRLLIFLVYPPYPVFLVYHRCGLRDESFFFVRYVQNTDVYGVLIGPAEVSGKSLGLNSLIH